MRYLMDPTSSAFSLTPLIVCGAARSGTRMAADLLNAHPAVVVQGEMHAKTLEAYFDLLERVEAVFEHYAARKGKPVDAHWRRMQERLHHMFLASANRKGVGAMHEAVQYHGIKTLGFERYFEQFERCFESRQPWYVYCMRDVGKVWRSWRTLGYLEDCELFKARYLGSLRQALTIRKRAGERFILFDLDRFITCGDEVALVERAVFLPLRLELSDEVRQRLAAVPNRNSARRLGLSYELDATLNRQMEELACCEQIVAYKELLR